MSARPFYQSPLAGNKPYQISLSKSAPFQAHWHGEIEILYVIRGSADITADGESLHLIEGQAAFIGSAEIHSLDKNNNDTLLLVIEVGYKLLGSGFTLFTGMTFEDRVVRLDSYPRLAGIINEIISLYSGAPPKDEKGWTAMEFRARSLLFSMSAEILLSVRMLGLGERSRNIRDDML